MYEMFLSYVSPAMFFRRVLADATLFRYSKVRYTLKEMFVNGQIKKTCLPIQMRAYNYFFFFRNTYSLKVPAWAGEYELELTNS